MAQYDMIIIGAGISGLSLAHYCAQADLKVLLLEKNDRPGGALHSHRFDGTNGFWLEMGAHTCYNSYGNLLGIMQDDGLLDRLLGREKAPFKLLIGNEVKSIPSQLNLVSLLPAIPRLFTLKKEGQTVKAYYSKLAGRGNYDKVLRYVFEAVLSQPADEFPAALLFKKRERRQDVIKKFTLPDGLQTIAQTIADEPNIEQLFGQTVTGIEIGGHGVTVSTEGGAHEGKNLALATPASVASKLSRHAFPAVSRALAKININKIESLGVAVKKTAVPLEKFANLIAVNDVFYSAVSRDVVPDDNYRGFTFHFKPDVTDLDAKLKRIGGVLRVGENELKRYHSADNYLPALAVGQENLITEIGALTAGTNLFVTGNYFGGVAIEDCVSRSLAEFKRLTG